MYAVVGELRPADQPRRGGARQAASLLHKMPGDRWQQMANVRAYLGFMWSHPGQAAALRMGTEFAQDARSGRRRTAWTGLVAARPRRAPGRPAPGPRPQRGLPGQPGAVVARHHAGRLHVDRRRQRGGQPAVPTFGTARTANS
ncbi:hypothetical protein ACU686_39795 [Yinghuangia aomiensis]